MINENCALVNSEDLPDNVNTEVKGYDFENGNNWENIMKSYASTGIQATLLYKSINLINEMIDLKKVVLPEEDVLNSITRDKKKSNCTIFLGFTSNVISSGLRESMKFLAKHNLIDAIVTTGGGIEEDFIKCMLPSYIGSFRDFNDANLRQKGMNRIGNMIVPNNNYVEFEKWFTPILSKMHEEQTNYNIKWTPSKLIHRLGKEINDENSVYYWCYRNNIPVYCPALTDGSIGDMISFYGITNPGFILDALEDVLSIKKQAISAIHSGMILLGSGIAKSFIERANMKRGGADFAVYINTGNEFEGSDAGSSLEECLSWNKIKSVSKSVKVHSEVTLVFQQIMSMTFAKHIENLKKCAL